MNTYTPEQLKDILAKHGAWLRGEAGGQRADLSGAYLSEADLSRANLSVAYLSEADLSRADLSRANLSEAYLSEAYLSRANLSRANLSRANLSGANLSGANLSGANLSGANLSEANLSEADLSRANLSRANLSEADLSRAYLGGIKGATAVDLYDKLARILPAAGEFTAFKKLEDGAVATVLVPKAAARTGNFKNRKCRASFVKVLSIIDADGKAVKTGNGLYDGTLYTVGKVTKAHAFDGDVTADCAPGIHFFMSEIEAREFTL